MLARLLIVPLFSRLNASAQLLPSFEILLATRERTHESTDVGLISASSVLLKTALVVSCTTIRLDRTKKSSVLASVPKYPLDSDELTGTPW